MIGHRTFVAERAARHAQGGRSPRIEWCFLAVSHGLALGGHTGARRAAFHLLQPLRALTREAGIWDRLLSAMSEAVDGEIVMIDRSSVWVHQHGAARKKEREN